MGSTTAGLTVAAAKEKGGEWMLEAGALVLADGGVCCIDEFDSIRKADRAAIHEAMEQQTLSVAKAGIVCKLSTRTTVIAAMNGKGRYDPTQSLSTNTALASPLLSRFDLIFILQDTHNSIFDKAVSSFILGRETVDNELIGVEEDKGGEEGEEIIKMKKEESALARDFTHPKPVIFSLEKLQSYISYIQTTFEPITNKEAETVLIHYYKRQRTTDQINSARTTIRLLESLIRLAQAHARLMFRNVVTLDDAIVIVSLMEMSQATSALLGVDSALQSTEPENPDKLFQKTKKGILVALGFDLNDFDRSNFTCFQDDQDGENGGVDGGEGGNGGGNGGENQQKRNYIHSQRAKQNRLEEEQAEQLSSMSKPSSNLTRFEYNKKKTFQAPLSRRESQSGSQFGSLIESSPPIKPSTLSTYANQSLRNSLLQSSPSQHSQYSLQQRMIQQQQLHYHHNESQQKNETQDLSNMSQVGKSRQVEKRSQQLQQEAFYVESQPQFSLSQQNKRHKVDKQQNNPNQTRSDQFSHPKAEEEEDALHSNFYVGNALPFASKNNPEQVLQEEGHLTGENIEQLKSLESVHSSSSPNVNSSNNSTSKRKKRKNFLQD